MKEDGAICALADEPARFAQHVLTLLENAEAAAELAARARAEVETNWDMAAITRKLVAEYRELARAKRSASNGLPAGVPDAL